MCACKSVVFLHHLNFLSNTHLHKTFAEKKYDGDIILGALKEDIDEEFADVSPIHRRSLWNHIKELKMEQQQQRSKRMLASVDFSKYKGSRGSF